MIVLGRTRPLALVRRHSPRAIRAVYLLTLQISSEAPVNPESGMLVNLTQIDAWMDAVSAKFAEREFAGEADLLRGLKKEFAALATVHEVSLELAGTRWFVDARDEVTVELKRMHAHVRGEKEELSPEVWVFKNPSADWNEGQAHRGSATHVWREDPQTQTSRTVI